MSLEIDGTIDLGPKWNYAYRIKNLASKLGKTFTVFDAELPPDKKHGPKMIDIIIKNKEDQPHMMKIIKAPRMYNDSSQVNDTALDDTLYRNDTKKKRGVFPRNRTEVINHIVNLLSTQGDKYTILEGYPSNQDKRPRRKKHKHAKHDNRNITTQEYTDPPKKDHTRRPKKEHTNRPAKEYTNTNPIEDYTNRPRHKHKKHKRINIDVKEKKKEKPVHWTNSRLEPYVNASGKHKDSPRPKKHKKNKNLASRFYITKSYHRPDKNEEATESARPMTGGLFDENITESTTKSKTESRAITVESFTRRVTSLIDSATYTAMYIETQLVKDDPKIKEFTKHVYEQSIKVFESIKKKMTNYHMKKEVDYLMKSYEDKFGEFVRETQNQKIKTRLGRQKVILNTVDTSNRIIERLVNYLIGKMDYKGVLRNEGSENVLQNEIHKKMELENKHICTKLHICRSRESFTSFLTDVLTIILSTDDRKITEAKDAITEVLKESDFSRGMNADTELRFRKAVRDMEKFDPYIMRPVFFIMKNIVLNRNAPIRVIGPEDSRVNKTMAFLDIIDVWDKKLPPNEKNILEWNDMRNSFKEWSEGKRTDIRDLMQSFTDHVWKEINNYDINEAKNFDRNINTILGY